MQLPLEPSPSPVQKADERHLLDRLKRMGITDWHEPLLCLPKSFEDFSRISTLKQALPRADVVSEPGIFTLVVTEKACIVSQPKKRLIGNATDGMLTVKIVVFIHPGVDVPPWKALEEGQRFHVRGMLQNWNGTLQMVSPTLVDPQQIGSVVPVYEKKRSIVADGAIYAATRHALSHHFEDTVKNLIASFHGLSEADILRRARLKAPSIAVILKAAHAPTSEDEGLRGLAAMRRLAALSIVENAKQLKQRHPVPESIVQIPPALIQELVAQLPHPLTGDQHQTIQEIVDDMASPLPMRRVVSGDVGSGKTFTIMIPALAVQRLGLRAVVLTPNGLLADQFVKECKEYFGQESNVVAVTAATKKLDLSSNPILVGTTALLTRLKGEKPPAFFCVDEEQKMSVGHQHPPSATRARSPSWRDRLLLHVPARDGKARGHAATPTRRR